MPPCSKCGGRHVTVSANSCPPNEYAKARGFKQVHKKSKTVTTLTDCMIWFFAFGLIEHGQDNPYDIKADHVLTHPTEIPNF